ncbi:hypothetical protein HMI01_11260 [Halolactibacillus miurensis]|uniref:Prophage CP4-57 regulatory protein (AlpA) n=1 Tax=Halolactibacillus miurensis TaxID=306541 RepID=A0A1I6SFT6_9BACI|nr:hypothetical protein [Halolactibacillus miurensis]GEM04138.1 hypothetical protein HMI01_11260 [Halolactibacillus miurensis]SFS75846.1 hypothetical protein SAMN05421668_10917 [Halolactibacillus miurensis]
MRNVRGAKALSEYLESIGAPISESTIFTLLREKKIPHQRPAPRILIFNLDVIDEWLGVKS